MKRFKANNHLEASANCCLICLKEPSDLYYISTCAHIYCKFCLISKKCQTLQCLKGCSLLKFPEDFSLVEKNGKGNTPKLQKFAKSKDNSGKMRGRPLKSEGNSDLTETEQRKEKPEVVAHNDYFMQMIKIIDAFEAIAKVQSNALLELIKKLEEKSSSMGASSSPARKTTSSPSYQSFKSKAASIQSFGHNDNFHKEIAKELETISAEKLKLSSFFKPNLGYLSVLEFSDDNSEKQERIAGAKQQDLRSNENAQSQRKNISKMREKSNSTSGFGTFRTKDLNIDVSQSFDINDMSEHKAIINLCGRVAPLTAGNSCKNKPAANMDKGLSDKTSGAKFVFNQADKAMNFGIDFEKRAVLKPVSSRSELLNNDKAEESKADAKPFLNRNYNSANPRQLNSILQNIFNNSTNNIDGKPSKEDWGDTKLLNMIKVNSEMSKREAVDKRFKKKKTCNESVRGEDDDDDADDKTESINNCMTERNEPEIERETIKNLMLQAYGSLNGIYHRAESGVEGEKKYLISAKWWRRWTDYVNFVATETVSSNAKLDTQEIPRPGTIVNVDLLASPPLHVLSQNDIVLKPNLLEHYDFEAVNKSIFKLLKDWYGVDYEILRVLRKDPLSGGKNIIDLYPKRKQHGNIYAGQEMNKNKIIANMLSRKMDQSRTPRPGTPTGGSQPRTSSVNSANSKSNGPPDEGYLKKYTNLISRWKTRYFILENGILSYFNEKGGALRGTIHMSISEVKQSPDDPLRIIINTGRKNMHLRVNTVADKLKWLNSLRKSQELIEKDTKIARRISSTRNKIIEIAGEELDKKKDKSKTKALEPINRKIEDIIQVHINMDDLIKEILRGTDPNAPHLLQITSLKKETDSIMKLITELLSLVEEERLRLQKLTKNIENNLDKIEGVRINVDHGMSQFLSKDDLKFLKNIDANSLNGNAKENPKEHTTVAASNAVSNGNKEAIASSNREGNMSHRETATNLNIKEPTNSNIKELPVTKEQTNTNISPAHKSRERTNSKVPSTQTLQNEAAEGAKQLPKTNVSRMMKPDFLEEQTLQEYLRKRTHDSCSGADLTSNPSQTMKKNNEIDESFSDDDEEDQVLYAPQYLDQSPGGKNSVVIKNEVYEMNNKASRTGNPLQADELDISVVKNVDLDNSNFEFQGIIDAGRRKNRKTVESDSRRTSMQKSSLAQSDWNMLEAQNQKFYDRNFGSNMKSIGEENFQAGSRPHNHLSLNPSLVSNSNKKGETLAYSAVIEKKVNNGLHTNAYTYTFDPSSQKKPDNYPHEFNMKSPRTNEKILIENLMNSERHIKGPRSVRQEAENGLDETVFRSFVNENSDIMMDSPRGDSEKDPDFGILTAANAEEKIVLMEGRENTQAAESEFNTDLYLVKFNINPFHPLYNVVKSTGLHDPVKLKLIGFNDVFRKIRISKDQERRCLPINSITKEFDLSKLIQQCINTDLTNFSAPISVKEPLSLLQRFCEQFENSHLLDKAATINDSCLRMAHVIGFAVSGYSKTKHRIRMPFMPLVGETFEYTDEKRRFRFFSEQIGKNPSTSAEFCESRNYKYWSNTVLSFTFWGKSLEVQPKGVTHLLLSKNMDHYVYTKPSTSIENILTGNINLTNTGRMKFTNLQSSDSAVIELKRNLEVIGDIKNKEGNVKYEIKGKWNEFISVIKTETKEEIVIWKDHYLQELAESPDPFEFSNYTLQMNHINEDLLKSIKPTDSRLRPDIRALEIGDYELSERERVRVEQKQNEKISKMSGKQEYLGAKWFKEELDAFTRQNSYVFSGERSKNEAGDFIGEDIF